MPKIVNSECKCLKHIHQMSLMLKKNPVHNIPKKYLLNIKQTYPKYLTLPLHILPTVLFCPKQRRFGRLEMNQVWHLGRPIIHLGHNLEHCLQACNSFSINWQQSKCYLTLHKPCTKVVLPMDKLERDDESTQLLACAKSI